MPASRKALEKTGWTVDDLDLVEANEAFAAQAIAVNRDMGWDTDKVNVNGGAIAMGHPLGATGAMILGTLIDELHRRGQRYGLAHRVHRIGVFGADVDVALAGTDRQGGQPK